MAIVSFISINFIILRTVFHCKCVASSKLLQNIIHTIENYPEWNEIGIGIVSTNVWWGLNIILFTSNKNIFDPIYRMAIQMPLFAHGSPSRASCVRHSNGFSIFFFPNTFAVPFFLLLFAFGITFGRWAIATVTGFTNVYLFMWRW